MIEPTPSDEIRDSSSDELGQQASVQPGGLSIEERLSLLIDDRLSTDQRLAVERELTGDADARAVWQSLQQQSSILKQVHASVDAQLPDSFADRVVDRAIDRAIEEGVGDDHPLILAANQPSAAVRTPSRRGRRAAMLGGFAVAASLGGLLFLRGGDAEVTTGPPSGGLARGPLEAAESIVSTPRLANDLAELSGAVAALPVDAPEAGPSDVDVQSATLPSDVVFTEEALAVDRAPSDDRDVELAIAGPGGTPDPPSDPTVSVDPVADIFTGAVMVFEVVCRDPASADLVLASAMQTAGLQLESQREISDGLVSAATDASGVDDRDSFQILYLSASGKRIDRLYLELLRDTANVRGVGLSLALSAPITDAAAILAGGSAKDVAIPVMESGDRRRLSESLRELTFLPMSPDGGLVGESVGGDEVAQAILIVR